MPADTRDREDGRAAQVAAWYRHRHPEAGESTVAIEEPPASGYSNELLFVQVSRAGAASSLVLRLAPTGPPLFPAYDLGMQVAVQAAAGAAGVPVAAPVELEADSSWLGAPFLVMPRVSGRHPGEAPMLTPWLVALDEEEQRRVQEGFLDALAAVHATPLTPELPLRGAGGDGTVAGLADELAWWEAYAVWACEGVAPDALLELLAGCRRAMPVLEAPPSLLWGDVRLGNVVVGDDLLPAAVLDWEMASIGPAESDLAWYTALSALTVRFVGHDLPGFLPRDAIIARHEAALGRALGDLVWHEAFALCRAAACHVRTGIAKAQVRGRTPADPASLPMVAVAADAVAAL